MRTAGEWVVAWRVDAKLAQRINLTALLVAVQKEALENRESRVREVLAWLEQARRENPHGGSYSVSPEADAYEAGQLDCLTTVIDRVRKILGEG